MVLISFKKNVAVSSGVPIKSYILFFTVYILFLMIEGNIWVGNEGFRDILLFLYFTGFK